MSDLSEEDAFDLEKFLIQEIGRKNINKGPLVNLTDGGDGVSGYRFTEVQIQKMSEAQKGKKSHLYGKTKEQSHLYGIKQSEEAKLKRSISLTGMKRSEKVVEAQSKRMQGTKRSDESVRKSAEAKLCPVICYTDSGLQMTFASLTQAASSMNIAIANISDCCQGKRISAGKHKETKEKLIWRKINAEQ